MSENLEKRIRSRSIQKHDLEVNWLKATTFIPYKGEFIIYDIEVDEDGNDITQTVDGVEKTVYELVGRTTPYTYERIKLGDGKTKVSELPFVDNTSLKYIEQELTEAQKAQARINIDAAKTISSANIPYVNGGGFQIDALEAYNQADSTKQNLPVTVADIKAVLNNFPLNLAEMQRAMIAGGSTLGEQGCAGVLPIPLEMSLQRFSDLPLFTTAPQKPSIAVRKDTGTLAVCDPISEDDATTKKYVDESIDTKTSVTVGGTHQKTFDADNYGKIRNNQVTYQRIPCIAGTVNSAGKKTNEVSQWLTPDFTLGAVNSLGTNMVIATYSINTGTRNISDTNSRHLWTSSPTKDFHCANKKYIDTNFIAKEATSQTITGDLTVTGNLQIKGISETVDAVTYKVENNLIEFNPDKTYNNTWLTGIAVNKGTKDEADLGTYGIMYDPTANSVKLGFGTISENHTFTFNENESAPIATREEFDDSWEDDAIFVFDKATKSFKYSGTTLSKFKTEIQNEMKEYVANYIETYMSQETIIEPDNSEILYVYGSTKEIEDEDGTTTLYVGGN